MPSATVMQTNFSAGELSPKLYARVDVSKYPNACYRLENFIVQRFGGIKKRGGTQFISTTLSNAEARLVPFVFSVTQAYILEFTNLRIRVYTNGGIVESSPGVPVEITSPYTTAQLFDLQFAQSADVLYITHPNHKPAEFTRTAATTFTLTDTVFEDGPYLELNASGTTMTPASRASYTPLMTNNTSPSGTVSSSPASADAYKVFDGDPSSQVLFGGATSGYIQYERTAATVSDRYWVTAPPESTYADLMPKAWTVQGSNDGSTWTTLDTRKGETGWVSGETRFYDMPNTASYSYLRFEWTGAGSASFSDTRIAEIGFNIAGDSQAGSALTASSTTGINEGSGFQSTDVGRTVRLLGSDGVWRWARIVAYTSTTSVFIRLYGHSLPSTSAIINWQIGAWSDETGWPGSVGFYSGRLCFARTVTQPQTVWMSVVDDFTNFGVSDPLQDDDAITATIASDSLNEIKWIAEGTDLFVGTTAAIRTIGPTTSTTAFSPTNIKQKRETNYGASSVQPVRVGQTALYSGYYRKDVREIAYSFESNGYVSTDLSLLSEHIPARGIKQMAYAQSPASIVWMVLDDGWLAGMTYERDQEVIAFHEHAIGGTAVFVESVATIPGDRRDETWLVVRRTIDGGTKRYVERLSEGLDDDDAFVFATFLDSHLTYSGTSTTTLTGLDHLEGSSVIVWGTGGKQGPYPVSSGSITLGSAVTTACVGLTYNSVMETLSPEAAARGGTAQTRLGKISEVFPRLYRSMGGTIGPNDGPLETFDYTSSVDNEGAYGTGSSLYSGDVRVAISMDWNRGKRLKLVHADPSPFHLLGLITETRVSG